MISFPHILVKFLRKKCFQLSEVKQGTKEKSDNMFCTFREFSFDRTKSGWEITHLLWNCCTNCSPLSLSPSESRDEYFITTCIDLRQVRVIGVLWKRMSRRQYTSLFIRLSNQLPYSSAVPWSSTLPGLGRLRVVGGTAHLPIQVLNQLRCARVLLSVIRAMASLH